MSKDLKLALELTANSAAMQRGLHTARGAVASFSRAAGNELRALKGMFSSIQGKVAALGLSFGAVKAIMDSAVMDKKLMQIAQTAGEGTAKVREMREDFYRMGKESGQSVESLREGFNVLIQSGQNMAEARESLKAVNIAMAVTGARAETLGAGLSVAATAFRFDLKKAGVPLELLDKMTKAGRLGNAELQNLSDIFARVGVNAKMAGLSFDATLAFIEGLSRLERNPERLATLADSTLRLFTNTEYLKKAQKATGIKFFDAKGARRDALDVLDDIKKIYDKKPTEKAKAAFLGKAFGKMDTETRKGLLMLLEGDMLATVRKFKAEIAEAPGTLKKDQPAAIANLTDQAGRLTNTMQEAADAFTKPIREVLADLIGFTLDKKDKGGMELSGEQIALGVAGVIGGTALAARFGGKAVAAIAGKFGGLGAGVVEGEALRRAAGVTPVFVVGAAPGLFGPGGLGDTGSPSVAGTKQQAQASWDKLTASAGGLGALGGTVVALAAGAMVSLAYVTRDQPAYSMEDPWAAMGALESGISAAIERTPPEVKNDITLNIRVDQNGRPTVSNSDPNTNTTINASRGEFFQ